MREIVLLFYLVYEYALNVSKFPDESEVNLMAYMCKTRRGESFFQVQLG
jgi:hypothetical protein